MAFIDNIKGISEKRDRTREKFAISIRKQIETSAENVGSNYIGFWAHDLAMYAEAALGKEPTVKETFALFDHVSRDLRNQGFKIEANAESGSVMFIIKW